MCKELLFVGLLLRGRSLRVAHPPRRGFVLRGKVSSVSQRTDRSRHGAHCAGAQVNRAIEVLRPVREQKPFDNEFPCLDLP
jgi:hypothetical protein